MKNIFSSLPELRSALVEHMKKNVISQKQAAKTAEVSQATISGFLAGKRTLSGRAVLRLQAFLLSEDGGENGEEQ